MQLYTDNHKDLRLLDVRGLTPLDPQMVGGETDLLAMIEGHNDRCACATARLRQLAEDRRRLAEFDTCRDRSGTELMAERARLRGATWDALRELRHVLEEREDVLGQIAQRLRERYDASDEEHDRTVAAAEKRLARERRRLERTNPSTAGSHFADLVEDDASVQAAAERNASSRRAFEEAADARRNVAADLRAVTTRQREVFAAMVE